MLLLFLAYPLTSTPSNIIKISLTDSVTLIWSQSSVNVVHNYIISYRRIAGGCNNAPPGSRIISGSLRTFTLTGLEEHITYEINVTAMNTANSLSALINATTLSTGNF